jgi:hypothetical protein
VSVSSQPVAANVAPPPSLPEIASVVLVIQASFSLVAGISAIPFGIVEPGFRVLSLITILIAIGMFWLARNLRRRRRWARRWVIGIEAFSLAASLLLMLLPIGTMRGPVPLLVNLVMPASVLWLLWSRSGRAAFRQPEAGVRGSDARHASGPRPPAREDIDGPGGQQDAGDGDADPFARDPQ